MGGHVPSVGFSYSSGSVDGLNSSENAQPSLVGVGWSMPQAVITRETRGCAAGGGSAESKWAGNLCMPENSLLDGFAISFNGVSGPLVRTTTSSSGISHAETGAKYWVYETQMASDLRIRRFEDTTQRYAGTSNGDWWVTWWEVTTGDGTLFVFGREFVFRPNGGLNTTTPATIQARTVDTRVRLESAQVVPLYYPGAGCPNSLCETAVAWHLDQVIDVSGNLAVYRHGTETNYYEPKYNGGSLPNRQYERNVKPWYVDYGRRYNGQALTPTEVPPYRVVFDYAERRPDLTVDEWPDTPTDLDCGQSENCQDGAPAFYTAFRLLQVKTLVRNSAGTDKDLVRSFVFSHEWPIAPGESGNAVSTPKLWLSSIDPNDENPVIYDKAWKDNRVNPSPSRMQMPRVAKVTNESGGSVSFTYGQSHAPQTGSCSTSNTSNVRRDCDMYVAWDAHTGSGGWVWWHKWKITQTVEDAGTGQGGSDPIVLTYSYPKPPEWAYAGKTGMGVHHPSQCRYGYGCNVWNDYRGHRQVNVTDATGARVEHYFYTGMENDRAYPTGTTGWLKDSPNAHNYDLAVIAEPGGNADQPNKFELAGRSAGTRTYKRVRATNPPNSHSAYNHESHR